MGWVAVRGSGTDPNRVRLLEFLRSEGTGDPEADHVKAEELLLAFADDEEITEAWDKTPQTWWYA